jgi:hypothetical protein
MRTNASSLDSCAREYVVLKWKLEKDDLYVLATPASLDIFWGYTEFEKAT